MLFFKTFKILMTGGIAAILTGVAAVITSVAELKKQAPSEKNKPEGISVKERKYSFWCDPYHSIDNKILPTTIITSDKEDIPFFTWEEKKAFGEQWSPVERCQVVSRRLQVFTDKHGDFFKYIISGTMNNYPVFCISETKVPKHGCDEQNLLITLIPGESKAKILEEIIAFQTNAIRVKRGSPGNSEIILDVQEYIRQAPRRQGKRRVIE